MKTVSIFCTRKQIADSGIGNRMAYGGHVYAQSVWAASQSVDREMVVHVYIHCPP